MGSATGRYRNVATCGRPQARSLAAVVGRSLGALLMVLSLTACSDHAHHYARTYWGDKPDSDVLPTTEDTGQPVSTTGGVPGLVASGALTMRVPTDGGAGLYRAFGGGETITRIGARFTFGSRVVGTTTSGVIALVMTDKVNSSDDQLRLAPHVYVGPTNWGLQSRINGVWHVYASGIFKPRLKIDATIYTAEIYLVGNTVTIVLPDGSVSSTSDPAFVPCNWGFVETAVAAPTDNIPGIVENWWDIGDQNPPLPRS
jgi:hypothetical protein